MHEIKQIEVFLKQAGFKVENQTNSQYPTLYFSEDESSSIPSPIYITLYPNIEDSDVSMLHFHFEYKISDDYLLKNDVPSRILELNKELVYGSFNFENNMLYYKYIMICMKGVVEQSILYNVIGVMIEALVNLVAREVD